RMPDFAHHQDIERPLQNLRHSRSHDYTTPRQSQHQVGFHTLLQQMPTEPASRILARREFHMKSIVLFAGKFNSQMKEWRNGVLDASDEARVVSGVQITD